MEKLFAALTHPDRLWIVMYLAATGPRHQKDLIAAFAEAHPKRKALSGGAMSNLVAPLANAGLIERDGRRSEVRLAHPEQLGRLLVLASAMSVAHTGDEHQLADGQHADLMRALTHAHAVDIEAPRG